MTPEQRAAEIVAECGDEMFVGDFPKKWLKAKIMAHIRAACTEQREADAKLIETCGGGLAGTLAAAIRAGGTETP